MTAPVAVFAYARPDHLRRTLESLAANTLASETQLIIFCDGPRSEEDAPCVRDVRDVAKAVTGFKSVEIRARDENVGLAANIIEGVTQVANAHGRVIVVEDDMVLARGFLSFMNAALDRYADEPKVWHVSGWSQPIAVEELSDTYFWRVMNCWGWATWADRWSHYKRDPKGLIDTWSIRKIDGFNLDGAVPDFWSQVEANAKGHLNTWAIFWYAKIFENDGLCLNPSKTLVQNIGLDGSGEHCAVDDSQTAPLSDLMVHSFPSALRENRVALRRIKRLERSRDARPIKRRMKQRWRLMASYGFRL